VDIPGAGLNITVPAGTDCLIVTFSVEMASSLNTLCIMRATLNNFVMNPSAQEFGRRAIFNGTVGEAVTYV
jgi:hypothetical protein